MVVILEVHFLSFTKIKLQQEEGHCLLAVHYLNNELLEFTRKFNLVSLLH